MRKMGCENNPKLSCQSRFWGQNSTKATQACGDTKTTNANPDQNHELTHLRTVVETCKAVLVHFMSCLNGPERGKDRDSSPKRSWGQRSQLTSKARVPSGTRHTRAWFGGPPFFWRGQARLHFLEEGNLPLFVPNELMSWKALAQVGNPTKLIKVNELIKALKKKEG